jgi:peptidoglycan hydrolase-like protein with peptidoglycan-binding domain
MKKHLQHIFILGAVAGILLLSLAASRLVFAQSTSPSVSSSSVTFEFGDRSVAIAALQTLLARDHYFATGSITGYFGPVTENAVKAFQKAKNLPQTETFTIRTALLPSFFASASGSSTQPMGLGATGSHVQYLQALLVHGGYLKLATTTEYFGQLTRAAVMAFQKAHNLFQTGVVDQSTFSAMNGK